MNQVKALLIYVHVKLGVVISPQNLERWRIYAQELSEPLVEGNIPNNQNLAVWFCARHGPTPFFAFGTPAPFRGTRAASRDHCTTGAAEKKKNYRH